ncbi:phosphotransferase family protein [Actinokineospora globicatena]|uniref:phosphotransferase family protein n=1 Tax=Actinokineospora globicatena TaxID=103729 RepID=UPI0020A3B920|nr:aminoglycoside phosphotransferase family protein [Actinokineospora globicatena]
MRWLTECSVDTVRDALRVVAPGLAELPITLPDLVGRDEPLWMASSAAVGEEFVAKVAWSAPAARRLAHEIGVLTALSVPFMPEVVASSTEPVLLVTRRMPGKSLFAVVDSIDRDHAGRQLAQFLVALHDPSTRAAVERALGPLPAPRAEASTDEIRARLGRWVRPDQHAAVTTWCAWADEVLAEPRPSVLVHGDLHGDNQVWNGDRLSLVVDFETTSAAEPEYDLRAFPSTGPDCELLTATTQHYEHLSGRSLSLDRIMAWHLRTTLDDLLWRSEARVPLPGHHSPTTWINDLTTRFAKLQIGP